MQNLAVDWTAVGSVATGAATIAAFLAILATIAVYYLQSRGDRATAIRENLQFIHGQQVQVLWLIGLGHTAILDRQIREFKERLGANAKPSYFINQLFNNHTLFRASAADSNLSSDAYARMSDLWDQINTRAFELRGALRVFSYACRALIEEPYQLCDPDFTVSILDAMSDRRHQAALGRIGNLDELANRVSSELVRLAADRFEDTYRERIERGSVFVGMLADITLALSDRKLLRLSRKRLPQPALGLLKTDLLEAVSASIVHLQPELSDEDMQHLRDILGPWRESRLLPAVRATGE